MRLASRALDRAVLAAYGWEDLDALPGYSLTKLEVDPEIEMTSDLQRRT